MPRPTFKSKKQRDAFRAKQHVAREANTQYANDLQVLTFEQCAKLEGTSLPTFKRQIYDGTGPRTIQLTARRRGVRVGDYRAWQEARLRSA
jgi:predicted DNA-binding transcriptional regulator AlpA